jgi:hypothetical protein
MIEFTPKTRDKTVNYVLADRKTDVGYVRETLRGKVFYVAIIDYKWVKDSLRLFKKVDIAQYNMETGYNSKEYPIKIEDESGCGGKDVSWGRVYDDEAMEAEVKLE